MAQRIIEGEDRGRPGLFLHDGRRRAGAGAFGFTAPDDVDLVV